MATRPVHRVSNCHADPNINCFFVSLLNLFIFFPKYLEICIHKRIPNKLTNFFHLFRYLGMNQWHAYSDWVQKNLTISKNRHDTLVNVWVVIVSARVKHTCFRYDDKHPFALFLIKSTHTHKPHIYSVAHTHFFFFRSNDSFDCPMSI